MKKYKCISLTTCDASEKFGPGDRFLLGAGGPALPAPAPELEPLRFLRLLAGRCASGIRLGSLSTLRSSVVQHNLPGGATIRCHFWNRVVLRQSRGLSAYALCLDINSCIGSNITHSCKGEDNGEGKSRWNNRKFVGRPEPPPEREFLQGEHLLGTCNWCRVSLLPIMSIKHHHSRADSLVSSW